MQTCQNALTATVSATGGGASDGAANDLWATAVKACGGIKNLPTDDELYALAKEVYGESNCNDSTKRCSGSRDYSKVPQLQEAGLGSSWWNLWSGREINSGLASVRGFGYSSGVSGGNRNEQNYQVVCLGDL